MTLVSFKELTALMASVLAATLEPESKFDLGTPEGLSNLFEAHGLERDVPQLIRAGGGSPDFILGLVCGVKIGKNQNEAAAQAAVELEAASRDAALAEIEPDEAPAGETAIVGNQP